MWIKHDLCFLLLEGNGGPAQNGAAMKGNGKDSDNIDFEMSSEGRIGNAVCW